MCTEHARPSSPARFKRSDCDPVYEHTPCFAPCKAQQEATKTRHLATQRTLTSNPLHSTPHRSRICECLQQGRQYSSKGRLLDEGHPAQVYECNLNCRCHKHECRNRLVQRGMTCSIKVAGLFRLCWSVGWDGLGWGRRFRTATTDGGMPPVCLKHACFEAPGAVRTSLAASAGGSTGALPAASDRSVGSDYSYIGSESSYGTVNVVFREDVGKHQRVYYRSEVHQHHQYLVLPSKVALGVVILMLRRVGRARGKM